MNDEPRASSGFGNRWVRWTLRACLVLASLGALEVLGALLLRLDPLASAEARPPAAIDGSAPTGRGRYHMAHESIHPFLGFVQDPDVGVVRTRKGRTVQRAAVSELGFGDHVVEAGDGSETLEVVVLGGSLANQLVGTGGRQLARRLSGTPVGARKRVRVRSLASGGYKQPQQLFALSWYLLLGNRVDVVINVDGFNDLVLGYTENLQDGVFPFYPRGWRWRVGNLDDVRVQAQIARLLDARERRARLATGFQSSPLRHSSIATYLWIRADQRLGDRESAAEQTLRSTRTRLSEGFAVTGPRFAGDRDDYLRKAVEVWSRSSLQIATLCKGSGIEYLHFLQPNQHDPGSKVLHSRESANMARANPTIPPLVQRGYPMMSAAGAELRSRGVAFFDLRFLFEDMAEPLYVDPCCHLGSRGNELLAGEIAAAVGRTLGPRQAGLDARPALSRRAVLEQTSPNPSAPRS